MQVFIGPPQLIQYAYVVTTKMFLIVTAVCRVYSALKSVLSAVFQSSSYPLEYSTVDVVILLFVCGVSVK